MQIMTITHNLNEPQEFDKEVNAALNTGWKLVKRDVLEVQEESEYEVCRYLALYAELEQNP